MAKKINASEFKALIQERVKKILKEHKSFVGWDGIPIDMDTRDFAVIATMDEPEEDIRAEAKYAFDDGQIDEIGYNRIIWYLENIKPTAQKKRFPVHMNEEGISAVPTQEEQAKEIYDEIEMRMRPDEHALSYSDINEIAETYGVDFEEVLNIMQRFVFDRSKEEREELQTSVKYTLEELERDGNSNPTFNEFVEKLNHAIEFTYKHSINDIKQEFEKLTKDPNQLSLFENIRAFIKRTLIENNLNELGFDQNGNPYGFEDSEDEMQTHYEKEIESGNIYRNKYNLLTIDKPIIPDAVKVLERNQKSVKFTSKIDFIKFAEQQKYFSASHSHCFYSIEEMKIWSSKHIKDPDSEKSEILFNTGHELVQVWDNKNNIGYIIPGDERLKEDYEEKLNSTNCMENPEVCMAKPETIMEPRGEI